MTEAFIRYTKHPEGIGGVLDKGTLIGLTDKEGAWLRVSLLELIEMIKPPVPAHYRPYKVTFWNRLNELFESVTVMAESPVMADDLFWEMPESDTAHDIESIELA